MYLFDSPETMCRLLGHLLLALHDDECGSGREVLRAVLQAAFAVGRHLSLSVVSHLLYLTSFLTGLHYEGDPGEGLGERPLSFVRPKRDEGVNNICDTR